MSKGIVYLVGAGPGDPGLLTLQGLEAIKEANCIIYDFLANSRLLEHAKPGTETVYVGKKGSFKIISQDEITKLIIKKAKSGKTVVRLQGGDPFIFGRGGEEAEGLVKEGIPFEIVPGVTSAIAVPAYAGIPLTHRDLSSSGDLRNRAGEPLKEGTSIDWKGLTPGRHPRLPDGLEEPRGYNKKLAENGWAP
jgi:uroporphyrinogen III methyltransferase/synthase